MSDRTAFMNDWSIFIWKAKNITALDDFTEAIIACKTREEAQEFLRHYSEWTGSIEVAKINIGYMTGYCSAEDALRIMDLFDCEHPYFGKKIPTPEEALKFGMEWGERMKKEEEAFRDVDVTFKINKE